MSFEVLFTVYALILGLIVGSYLNVVIHRLPRGLSTVFTRSHCPACGKTVSMVDNIPLLSFLALRGRCRGCGDRISARYPMVELLTGLLFVAAFLRFGATPWAIVAAVFCAAMVALAAIDIEHYILPDRITLPGIAIGLAANAWVPGGEFVSALIGALLGGGLLLTMAAGWYLLRKEEGMGLGDVKMLAMVGAFIGWKGVLMTLFVGAFMGAILGLALIGLGRGGAKTKLPFGAFLAAGGLFAIFFGERIANAYLSLF